jgi:hypothetical protein
VLADGVVAGRIMKVHAVPVGTPWMWTLANGQHEDRTATHGYEPTREAVMTAFVKSWRYESRQRRVNRAETITMAPSCTSYG